MLRNNFLMVAATILIGLGATTNTATAKPQNNDKCDKLTGRDRSKCLAEVRRNRSDDSDAEGRSATRTSTRQPTATQTSRTSGSSNAAAWGRIDVATPSGFPRYDQLDSGDGRLYASSSWADGIDTVSKVPRKKLTCLATVYAMIEHARGNSRFRVSDATYSDQVGALGINGIGSSRALTDMEVIRSEFQNGNAVVLWGPLTRNPSDPFGHFILAIGVDTDGQIVAHDPYGGKMITVNPATRKVNGSSAISVVEKYRTVKL